MVDAYQELLAPSPALRLVLAPRHPQRAPDLARLLARRGLNCQLWTGLKSGRKACTSPVVIVDTIGDLFTLYGAADVAFVGGSLVPHGGQNILEPAAWGRAPIYGPHLGNFLWAQAIIEAAGAGIVVHGRHFPGPGRQRSPGPARQNARRWAGEPRRPWSPTRAPPGGRRS